MGVILKFLFLTLFINFSTIINFNIIVCQNSTDDFVYDYPSLSENSTGSTNVTEVKDEYAYDYVSSAPEDKTSVAPKTTAVSDDYAYDYVSGSPNNTNIAKNSTSSDDYVYDYVTTAEGNASQPTATPNGTAVSDDYVYDYGTEHRMGRSGDHKPNETDSEDESTPSSEENTTTDIPLPEDDFGYDDEEQGECDRDTKLTKMIALHEENRNTTDDYKIKHFAHINETFERIKYVRDFYEKYYGLPKGFGTQMLAFVGSIDIVLSTECFASLFSLISGYRNNKWWANKFTDSMGRILQTGSGDGKHSSFGEYDECLDLESPDDKGLIVKGQYCLVKVLVPYPKTSSFSEDDPYDPYFDDPTMTPFTGEKYWNGMNATTLKKFVEGLNLYGGASYRLGLCTPHLCKRHEIEEFLNKMLYPIVKLPLQIDTSCHRKDKTEGLRIYEIISILILTVLFVAVITSTGIEIYNRWYSSAWERSNKSMREHFTDDELEAPPNLSPYYYTFSLVANGRDLFDKSNRLSPLDTIRLFVILLIYIFHLYNTMATIGIVTLKRTFATYPSLVLENDRYFFMRNTLLFDIIVVLSGFIAGNNLLARLEKKNGKFNYLNYVIGRYLRFAIPLLGSIIFMYGLRQFGSGPIWEEGTHWLLGGCENPLVVLFGFLFVSNYNDEFGVMDRQQAIPYCNPSTWLLSALLQMHLVIPLLVLIYYKNERIGIRCMIGAVVLGLGASIAPVLWKVLPITQYLEMRSYEEIWRSFTWYHLSTTQYIVPFLAGLIAGCLSRKELYFQAEYLVGGWAASGFALVISLTWNNVFWKTQQSSPLYNVLLWYTLGKLMFGASMAWFFYCLHTGKASTLENLLSHQSFRPFARLSFSFFMVHFIVIIRRVFTVKETITMSDGLMMEYSILDIMYTMILAYLFYSMVEAPFTYLLNQYLSKREASQSDTESANTAKDDNVVKIHVDCAEVDEPDRTEDEVRSTSNLNAKSKLKSDFGHFQDIELEEDVNRDLNHPNRVNHTNNVNDDDDDNVQVFRF